MSKLKPPTKPEKPKRYAIHIRGVEFLCVPGSRREKLLLKFKARDDLPTIFTEPDQGMPYLTVVGVALFAFALGFGSGLWL